MNRQRRAMCSGHLLWVAGLLTSTPLCVAAAPASLLPGRPFVTVWNAPTSLCWQQYGVELDLDPFDIVVNQNQSFVGSEMVIFYHDQLGLYPYYDQNDQPINSGLPQNASLSDHLNATGSDLAAAIPSAGFTGAAVIDWEEWRPLWERNWDAKAVYQRRSRERVWGQHPAWPAERVEREAKAQFEGAAAGFMAATLELGRKLRPGGLWGFYGLPCCYNYDYKRAPQNYTGQCPPAEVARNDLLRWLWASSRALYPDIYLEQLLKGTRHVGPYVKHRVLEALRLAERSDQGDIPVLPYARIVYTYSMDFLTQEDLMNTIGESAAQGTAGVILWGNNDYRQSKEACLAVKRYIDDVLGTYVVNVTCGAALCSRALCAGNGRCVRRDPSSATHLHLNPNSFTINRNAQGCGFQVLGEASTLDIFYMATHFQCRCYPGWKGPHCSKPALPSPIL